jgi:hypothetical protein
MRDGSRAPLLEKEAYPSAEDNMSRDCQGIVTLLAGKLAPGTMSALRRHYGRGRGIPCSCMEIEIVTASLDCRTAACKDA